MASSVASFCRFAELKDRIPFCASQGKKSQNPCGRKLLKNQPLVKAQIAEIHQEAIISLESFAELANVALCHTHVSSARQAQNQWYDEWKSTNEDSHDPQTNIQHPPLQLRIKPDGKDFNTSEGNPCAVISTPSSPMNFTPIAPNTSAKDIMKRVIQILRSPPNEQIKKVGFVYIMSLHDSPGLLKVGSTTKGTEERMRIHRKCYSNIDLVNEGMAAWAGRIEKLVHAELSKSQYRQRKKCRCGSAHRELFNIGLKEIKESVHKWTRFFLDYPEPYDEDGALKGNVVLPEPYGAYCRTSYTSTPTKTARQGQDDSPKGTDKSSPKTPNNSSAFEITFAMRKLSFW